MVTMVRIERKLTKLVNEAIISLEKQKTLKEGTHNTPEVNAALQEIFHQKCYICENQSPSSYQIDHLQPQSNGTDNLKFNWNNLFLSCAHCNNIKSNKYYPILDCTQVDVDDIIKFKIKGNFIFSEELDITAIDDSNATKNTCKLLKDVYYGTTPQKVVESNMLRRKLFTELEQFCIYIRKYFQASGDYKKDLYLRIKLELKNTSEFTAFKRWIIRDNSKKFEEFIDCWKTS